MAQITHAAIVDYLDRQADEVVARLERLDASVARRPRRRHIVEHHTARIRRDLEAELEFLEDAMDLLDPKS